MLAEASDLERWACVLARPRVQWRAMTPPTAADLDTHRPALLAHCYRMMASQADAEDAVQEALIKAHRSLDRFEGRSSLKTWLTSIATRVCLDLLEQRNSQRRLLTASRADIGSGPVPLNELDTVPLIPASGWVEPIADSRLDPELRLVRRESVRLAWVAALQTLAPRQRAALLMAEVLDLSAAEIAEALSTTVPAVNSALQRAREMLSRRSADGPEPRPLDAELVERFVSAFERYDTQALTLILREDAVMSMPPFSIWLEGPASISAWLVGRGAACRGSRLVPTSANGQVAFGQYKPAVAHDPKSPLLPWALVTLEAEPSGERLESMTFFLDTATLFPRFGLPAELPR